nr:hypothetical protein [Paenibacillus pseudetheri]
MLKHPSKVGDAVKEASIFCNDSDFSVSALQESLGFLDPTLLSGAMGSRLISCTLFISINNWMSSV